MGRAMISAFLHDVLDLIFQLASVGMKSNKYHEVFQLISWLQIPDTFLDDAEQKQFTERGSKALYVKDWLDQLQDAIYCCEELLLQINSSLPSHSLPLDEDIKSGVRGSIERLLALLGKTDELGLTRSSITRREYLQGLPSSSAVLHAYFYSNYPKDGFYGRDEEMSILEHLLSTSASKQIKVINIVGKAGLGKTALADVVYFNHKVRKSFEEGAWVSSLSHQDTTTFMVKTIHEAGTEKFVDYGSFDELMLRLFWSFYMKKSLLVLDDSLADKIDWSKLTYCFGGAAKGSAMILIQDQGVPESHNGYTVHLDSLSIEDCWLIFMEHASGKIDLRARPTLEAVGKQIVSKLGNLPFAARMIGSLLQDKLDQEQWDEILRSRFLDAGNDENPRLPGFLVLCFLDLPAQIKRCFAYLSIFPKGCHFVQKKVVLLWMAQGFLKNPDSESNGNNLEDIGDEYFGYLIMRSFLQPYGTGDTFVMHNLVHDLATYVFGGSYKHHLFHSRTEDFQKTIMHPTAGTSLRTILSKRWDVITKLDPLALRALSLIHPDIIYKPCSITILALPDSIGRLKHLCYLDLSFTPLQELPDSICDLFSLQTLMLTDCHSLASLPKRICNLINLRYLDVTRSSVKEMPPEMHKLTSLRTLIDFIISKNGPRLEDLAGLPPNLQTLAISELQNMAYPKKGSDAMLKEMKSLDDLMFKWCRDDNYPSDFDVQVLEYLEPHKNLKRLTVEAYSGARFPNWLGDSSYLSLQSVALRHCKYCKSLPTLGLLPFLKDLSIEGFSRVESIGREFYGEMTASQKPFQSLESLQFRYMLKWRKWEILQGIEFPRLIKLCIIECPELVGDLPKHLLSLKRMEIFGCRHLKASLPKVSNTCEVFVHEEVKSCVFNTRSQASLRWVTFFEAHENISQFYSVFPSSNHTIGSSSSEIEEITPPSTGSKLPLDFPSSDPQSSMAKADSLITKQAAALPHTDAPATTAPVKVETSSKQDLDDQQLTFEVLEVSNVSQLCFLPPKLDCLKIEGCEYVEALRNDLSARITTSNLNELYLISCSSLKSFPYPGSLTTLYIRDCKRLESLPSSESCEKLAHLFIVSSCDSLTTLDLNLFSQLKTISIFKCPHLESLKGDLASLESLDIRDCPTFKSFPHAPNLESITLLKCKNLENLPKDMKSLASLETLFLHNSPKIKSFPSGGLPSSLSFLSIADCDKLIPQKDWGLYNLESLDQFQLEGGCIGMESFPQEKLLPCNINTLLISKLKNLKKIDDKGFQHMNALRTLEIRNCDKLCSLPDQGLPSSLYHLRVVECPLLTGKLVHRTGGEWRKVAHIRHIQIDDHVLP